MRKITAIRNSRQQQVTVYLDGKPAFTADTQATATDTLQESDQAHRCLATALRYLGYRPRSESEIRERLGRRGFDNDTVAGTIAQLRERGLIDDRTFAQFWTDNRATFRPRSQRLTRLELKRKGVAADIVDRVVRDIDDEESAYQAARGKLRGARCDDYGTFRRQIGNYLRRRGFNYEVINSVVKRVWQEVGKTTAHTSAGGEKDANI